MYNGIGLQTARGSATSGYVTKNRGYVPPRRVRQETALVSGHGGPQDTFKAAVLAKANQEILEHKRKRQIEAQVYEMEERMRDQGYSESEIKDKATALRERLKGNNLALVAANKTGGEGSEMTDTHEVAARKAEEIERLRNAFGIAQDHVEGETWDPEAQNRRREDRHREREEKRKKRQVEEIERKKRLRRFEGDTIQGKERRQAEERREMKGGRNAASDEEDDRWRPSADEPDDVRGGLARPHQDKEDMRTRERADYRAQDGQRLKRTRSGSRDGGMSRIGQKGMKNRDADEGQDSRMQRRGDSGDARGYRGRIAREGSRNHRRGMEDDEEKGRRRGSARPRHSRSVSKDSTSLASSRSSSSSSSSASSSTSSSSSSSSMSSSSSSRSSDSD